MSAVMSCMPDSNKNTHATAEVVARRRNGTASWGRTEGWRIGVGRTRRLFVHARVAQQKHSHATFADEDGGRTPWKGAAYSTPPVGWAVARINFIVVSRRYANKKDSTLSGPETGKRQRVTRKADEKLTVLMNLGGPDTKS